MTNAADMMADLARRLASGESPEDISRSLVPECWRPALRACAAARMFDSALYERTLRPWAHRATGEEPPSWSDLVEQGAVIPARWQHGQYALTDSDRSSYFREWLKPTPSGLLAELEELEKDVARYWGAAGDEVEQLRHLLLGAPERAVSLFDRLFAQADEDGDFAACEDLVDVLGDPDRSVCLAPELRQRYRDCSGYVRTRSFWAADYARAAQYLPGRDRGTGGTPAAGRAADLADVRARRRGQDDATPLAGGASLGAGRAGRAVRQDRLRLRQCQSGRPPSLAHSAGNRGTSGAPVSR